eukprot:scaffold473_cov156-Amphora_coffeaeformis.AAC.13
MRSFFSLLAISLLSTTPASVAFSNGAHDSNNKNNNSVRSSSAPAHAPETPRRRFLGAGAAVLLGSVILKPKPVQAVSVGGRIQFGDEDIMRQKGHGTSEKPVQSDLLYGVDTKLADKICNFNRHFAEMGGYFRSTSWEDQVMQAEGPLTYYDSVTGKPLFVAPINRSKEDFLAESRVHGWPSFRDDEVVWENVRVLRNSGETVSVDGTHLGHDLPDRKGHRYCINLVSIAGKANQA